MIKSYFNLIKPGIMFANLISVIGGIFFALKNEISIFTIFYTLFATSCVISSGCVFNNIIDVDIDKKMARTRHRVLVQSLLPILHVKIFGCFLLFLGILIFFVLVNILSGFLAIFGFIVYVFIYSLYMKRNSMYSVIFGSLSGAIPALIGYCAITNFIDFKAVLLFMVVSLWQIPHSYSIFIIYLKDYKSANLPIIVLKKGVLYTVKQIIIYILFFLISIILLYVFKYVNLLFLIILLILGILWLLIAIICYFSNNYYYFSYILFYLSILIIIMFNILLIISYKLCF